MSLRNLLVDFCDCLEMVRFNALFTVGGEFMDLDEDSFFSRIAFWRQIFLIFLVTNVVSSTGFQLLYMIQEYSDLMTFFIGLMYCCMILMNSYAFILALTHRKTVLQLLLDHQELFFYEDPLIKCCEDVLRAGIQDAKTLIKVLRGAFFASFLGTFFIGICVSVFLEHSSFPLPLPYHLPFLKPQNTLSYLANMTHQVMAIYANFFGGCMLACPSFTMALFINVWQKMAIKVVTDMPELVKRGSWEKFLRLLMKLQIEFRNSLHNTRALFVRFFFMMEKCCYCVLFTCWIIYQKNPLMVLRASVGFAIFVVLFFVVLFNEMYQETFNDLAFALYDTPWYNLPARQQKAFIICLSMAQAHIEVVAGLNSMTLAWYSNIYKEAYSMSLVLSELI